MYGRWGAASIAAVLLLASACARPEADAEPRPGPTVAPTVSTTTTAPATTTTGGAVEPPLLALSEPEGPDLSSGHWAARADGPLDVYAQPGTGAPETTLDPTTILGTPTVVLVRDATDDGWLRVALPGRPNGREGWIRADDVGLFQVTRRVVVDLDERMLTVYEGDEELLVTPVAVGSEASPTPPGSFFVTDAVEVLQPSGPWGRYAFGLSARSDTVTEFNGGDGIIGIHGTNRPESIGHAASLGCVRVPNETMDDLWGLLSVGTPVEIKA